jgi:autotransporter-associated beta strand protein
VGGNGTLTFTGTNSCSAGTTITGGTLLLNGVNGGGALNGPVNISGGATLQVGNGTTNGSVSGGINDNSTLVFLPNGSGETYSGGGISGGGVVTVGRSSGGSGVLTLGGSNNYTGGTNIISGVLSISSDNLGSGGGLTFQGGTLQFFGASSITMNRSITLSSGDSGTISTASGSTATIAGTISGAGSLTISGGGTLTLAATNTYSGGTMVGSGTLQLGSGGSTGTLGSGAVTANGSLVFDRSDSNLTVANNISGAGSLTQLGSGTLTLTGNNASYAGGVVVLFVTRTQPAIQGFTVTGRTQTLNVTLSSAPSLGAQMTAIRNTSNSVGTFSNLSQGTVSATYNGATYWFQATYTGTNGNTLGLTAIAVPTTTTLRTSQTSVTYGTPVTFRAIVSAQLGSVAPTAGSVDFYDTTAGRDLGAGTLATSTGTTSTWTLTTGVKSLNVTTGDTITATYTPGTAFAGSSGTGSETVSALAITVTAAAGTKTYDGTTSSTATPTIIPAVVVTTLAGSAGQAGSSNGTGSAARLDYPFGAAVDSAGNVYVADTSNDEIRKITPSGVVTTLAGSAGQAGSSDGTGSAARFARPRGVAVDNAGNIFVADDDNDEIRAIRSVSLATGDTAAFTESYSTKNAGMGLTLTPAGSVDDGNGGNNYAVTFANSTAGQITARAITVTAAPCIKDYDGTTASTAAPTITGGSLVGGDTAAFSEAYDSSSPGTGITLSPQGSVNDGNWGWNYSVSYVANTTGEIDAIPTSTSVTTSDSSATYGTPITLAASVLAQSGDMAPTGNVDFVDTTTQYNLGYGTFQASNGTTSTWTWQTGAKTFNVTTGDAITATYVPSTGFDNSSGTTTQSITLLPVTVTAASCSKTYDGTTSSSAAPTLTFLSGEGLVRGDTPVFSETFDTPDAGSSHTVTPTGSISDGNGGGNYAVTPMPVGTGVISPAIPSIYVTPYCVTYDATPHTATGLAFGVGGVPLSGLNFSGTTHTNAQTFIYDDYWSFTPPNGNYSGTGGFVEDIISPAGLTITAATNTKMYDGTTSAAATPTVSGLLGGDSVNLLAESYTDPNAGTGKTLIVSSYSICDGNGGSNYSISFVGATGAITPAASISGPTSVDEGSDYRLGLAAAFSSNDAISQWQVNWGDGTVQTVQGDPASVDHVYAAAPARCAITASETDNYGTFNVPGQVAVQVQEVPPELYVVGNQQAVVNQSLPVSDLGTFTYPGFDNPTFTYQIQWGDESSDSGTATINVPGQPPGANGEPPVATQGSFNGAHSYTLPGTYTVTVNLTDSDGEAASPQTFLVFVAPAGPAVSLGPADANGQPTADSQAVFVEGDASAPIASADGAISDPASTTLQSLTATIGDWTGDADESLAADTTGTNITASWDDTSGTLTLSGSDTLADYQQVLDTMTYSNTASDLTSENGEVRTISVVAFDGTSSSPAATASITLLESEQPPVARNVSATTGKDVALVIPLLADNPDEGDAPSVSDVYSLDGQQNKVEDTSADGVPLTIFPDGTVEYDPTSAAQTQQLTLGQSLPDTFFYTISNSHGLTSTTPGEVTVVVTGQNDPPASLGIPDVAHADGGPSTVIHLTQYFTDSQNSASALTYSVVGDTSPALFSSVSVNPSAHTLTLAYAPGAHGAAELTVEATNPQDGLSAETTFTVRSAATTPTLSNVTLNSQVNEGQTATLSGTLSGNGPLTLTVDWGDASDPDTVTYQTGTSFSVTHEYLQSADYGDGSGYTVELGLTDSLGMTAQRSASIYVAHVPPTLGNVTLTGPAGVSDIDVGDTGTLAGTISAPNPQEGFTLDVDWGDGSTDSYTLDPGTTNFFGTHTFDAPSSGATLTLTDDYGSTATPAPAATSVVAPSLGDSRVTPVTFGQPTTLSGNIENANANNSCTVYVDWGDGTVPDCLNLGAGAPAFSDTHSYSDENPPTAGYPVEVTLCDSYGDSNTQNTTAALNDTPPALSNLQVTPSYEGSLATLTGNFGTVSTLGNLKVQVDWGDNRVDTLYYPPNAQSFNDYHVYGQQSPTGGYPVSVTVTDAENTTSTASTTAVVNDVAPTLSGVSLIPPSILENGNAVLSGSITASGWKAPLTLSVAWGDGTNNTYTYPAGTKTFEETHRYVGDNPAGNPANVCTVNLAVSDGGVNANTASITVGVQPLLTNVAIVSPVNVGETSVLHGMVQNLDPDDSFTIGVGWDDGSNTQQSYPAGTQRFTLTHVYTQATTHRSAGNYIVIVTLADDNGNTFSTTASAEVDKVGPTIQGNNHFVQAGTNQTVTFGGTLLDSTGGWTGSVDYGDYSQPGSLTFNGSTFSTSHVYTGTGVYQATVTITDGDGSQATATYTIIVQATSAPAGEWSIIATTPVASKSSLTDGYFTIYNNTGVQGTTSVYVQDEVSYPYTYFGVPVANSAAGSDPDYDVLPWEPPNYNPPTTRLEVTLGPGGSETFAVTPIDNGETEDKVVVAMLSSVPYTTFPVSGAPAVVTVAGDDSDVVSISPALNESGASSQPMQYTVSRTGPTTHDLYVGLSLGGTAVPGTNYNLVDASGNPLSSPLDIPAGSSSINVYVQPVGQLPPWGDETVTLTLSSSGSGYTANPTAQHADAILDAPNVPTVSFDGNVDQVVQLPQSGYTDAYFSLKLSQEVNYAVDVYFDEAGSALLGSDYELPQSYVEFPANYSGDETLDVRILGSTLVGDDKTLLLAIDSTKHIPIPSPDHNAADLTIQNNNLPEGEVQLSSSSGSIRHDLAVSPGGFARLDPDRLFAPDLQLTVSPCPATGLCALHYDESTIGIFETMPDGSQRLVPSGTYMPASEFATLEASIWGETVGGTDVELLWKKNGGGNAEPLDTVHVTVVDIVVRADKVTYSDDTGTSVPSNTVAWLPVNDNHDCYQGEPDYVYEFTNGAPSEEHDLMPVKIFSAYAPNENVGGVYSLTFPSFLRVWANSNHTQQISEGDTLPVQGSLTVWVEAIGKGSGSLALSWTSDLDIQTLANVSYQVVSSFEWGGPENVPDCTKYAYWAAKAAPNSMWTTDPGGGATYVGSNGAGSAPDNSYGWFTFGEGAAIAGAAYQASDYFSWDYHVNVVDIWLDESNNNSNNVVDCTQGGVPRLDPAHRPYGVSSAQEGRFTMSTNVGVSVIGPQDSMGNIRGTGEVDIALAENVVVNSWQFTELSPPGGTTYYSYLNTNGKWTRVAGGRTYFDFNGFAAGIQHGIIYCSPREGVDGTYTLSAQRNPWATLYGPGAGRDSNGNAACKWTSTMYVLVHATDDNEDAAGYGETDPNIGRYTQRGTAQWVMDISGTFDAAGHYTPRNQLGSTSGIRHFTPVDDPEKTYKQPTIAFVDAAYYSRCEFKNSASSQ